MNKIPCIKCTPELWEYIKPYLEEWGYRNINKINSEEFLKYQLLVVNQFGWKDYCNLETLRARNFYDRELTNNVEEFLEQAAKLKGFTYKRKDMEFHGIEIKAGMIIVIDEPNVDNIPYIVFPRTDGLAVVLYGTTTYGIWEPLKDFINTNYNIIKRIYDVHGGEHLFGNIIWEKGPKEIILTMDEIAKKFGVSVEQIKIKK